MSERGSLILSGDDNNMPQELRTSDVNHLRRLLAWFACEYNLYEEGQRGFMRGLDMAVRAGADVQRVQSVLDQEIAHIQHVPAYVRQAVKMLQKAIREHDTKTGVIQA